MSMTTSFLNFCLKSIASRATHTAASGSSPFTWKIGAPIIFATSVQYSDDLASEGDVVKPIWLLTMMWIVPPVRYPRSSARFSVSATTPWRSEEHTSELQSHVNLVCRLLLEKKKENTRHMLTEAHSHTQDT